MAVVPLRKHKKGSDSDRWLQLYDRRLKLQAEINAATREMRTLKASLSAELRTFGMTDEGLHRELMKRD